MLEQVSNGCYRLSGSVTMREGASSLAELFAVVDAKRSGNEAPVFELDLSGLTTTDSAMLAGILEIGRRLSKTGRQLKVLALPDGLQGLARVYGIDALLQAYR